jgi:TPR repeat protein
MSQGIAGKEMAKVSSISTEPYKDWYRAISKDQPDGVVLKGADKEMFHYAFKSLTAGTYGLAYEGFLELSGKGSSISQYFLGEMCLKGMGVLQDFSQAHMWFNIAASQGHKKAKAYLDRLTIKMSSDQVAEAQKLAREWVAMNHKGY